MTTKTIAISGGVNIEVGPISWAGYRKIRNKLVEALSGPIAKQIASVFLTPQFAPLAQPFVEGTWGPGETARLLAALVEAFKGGASELIGESFAAFEALEGDVVRHSCRIALLEPDMPATDWFLLRDAAFEVNDFAGLWELEKNFFSRTVLGQAAALLSNGTKIDTPSDSTSDGSTSLPQATAGTAA